MIPRRVLGLSLAITVTAGLLFAAGLSSVATAEEKLPAAQPTKLRAYIGTYTGKDSKGIYFADFDLATGKFITAPKLAAELASPSFLALSSSKKYLYAVSEVSSVGPEKTGEVAAFQVSPDGPLKELNRKSSGGAGPCHLSVDPSSEAVLVANYGSGSVAMLVLAADGSFAGGPNVIQHTGKSVDPGRQESPHAHSINIHPAGNFAYAADLGLDKVLIYRFFAKRTIFKPSDPPFVNVAPGSGPRHLAFLPSGKFAYVINEMANTIIVFACDEKTGELRQLQSLATLPADSKGNSNTAEIVVHPSGKFLYGSNRGHDSIASFAIKGATGLLTATGHTSTGGKQPRNFAIDPTGKYLFAENQASDTIHVFVIDPTTGKLSATGEVLKISSPVCLRFLPLE